MADVDRCKSSLDAGAPEILGTLWLLSPCHSSLKVHDPWDRDMGEGPIGSAWVARTVLPPSNADGLQKDRMEVIWINVVMQYNSVGHSQGNIEPPAGTKTGFEGQDVHET
ncbi:hypothetical protein N7492_007458 [Penicillium capsulatum]|uniref:Uncharacterized protein n=1 Tax=Penicillium capsulatum TaxID=69766 RepID=A0A9W9I2A5_9EURO|nr:hypothetical protein N7492_007458 [Penicillium capsulatum]